MVIPAGCFLTGTIWLKSDVELHLSHGALLKASSNMEHYNELDDYPQNFDAPHEGWNGKHLIIALEQENVDITDTTGCPLYADIPLNESGLLSFEGARRLVLDNIRIFVKDDYFDKRSNVFSFSETDISSQNITLIYKEKQTKL